jgi:flagellar motor switch protein FliG
VPLAKRFIAVPSRRTPAASTPTVSTRAEPDDDDDDDVARLDVEALRLRLLGEPPHVVAAIVSRLPAPTALAVLERYETLERAEIVKRCGRGVPMLVQDVRL